MRNSAMLVLSLATVNSFFSACGASEMTDHKGTCLSNSADGDHDDNTGVFGFVKEVRQATECTSSSSYTKCHDWISASPTSASSSLSSSSAAAPLLLSACDNFFASWKYPNTEYTVS